MTLTETDPSDIVTGAINEYDEELFQIAAVGVAFGAGVFMVKRGWRLVKSLVG